METMKLTGRQSLRIAELPEDYRVVGVDRSAPFVRKPRGQLMRIQEDGRLTVATVADRRRLSGRQVGDTRRLGGVRATTPYTSVVGD
jgi:hypothetical protein